MAEWIKQQAEGEAVKGTEAHRPQALLHQPRSATRWPSIWGNLSSRYAGSPQQDGIAETGKGPNKSKTEGGSSAVKRKCMEGLEKWRGQALTAQRMTVKKDLVLQQ